MNEWEEVRRQVDDLGYRSWEYPGCNARYRTMLKQRTVEAMDTACEWCLLPGSHELQRKHHSDVAKIYIEIDLLDWYRQKRIKTSMSITRRNSTNR